jgi:hypothetical protein
MGKLRFTAQQVADALQACKGMLTVTAQYLNCDVDTVLNYCKRYPICEAAKRGARDEVLDEAELRLVAAIQRDESWAITFCLRTIGRSRGYGERLDIGLTVKAAAEKVAAHTGLTPEAILAEAQEILLEIENDGT